MKPLSLPQPDPKLDLVLERTIDVPLELVWRAWTTPEMLKKWFTPAPWQTIDCQIDLRPGGLFRTVMRSPEGKEFPNLGCYLEVIENERLTWTNTMLPGFRPSPGSMSGLECDTFPFTAFISLEPAGAGTKYRAMVVHGDAANRDKHNAMGFTEGWGAALDQLVALAKTM